MVSISALRLLPCGSMANERVTPPPSAFSMTKFSARSCGNSIPAHRSSGEMAEMRQHPFGREFALQHLPARVIVGGDRNVGGVALVAGAGMGEVIDADRSCGALHDDFRRHPVARDQHGFHRQDLPGAEIDAAAGAGRALHVQAAHFRAHRLGGLPVRRARGDAQAHLIGFRALAGIIAVERVHADQVDAHFLVGEATAAQAFLHHVDGEFGAGQRVDAGKAHLA